jgi:4-hydroxy-tetrahydrodipicolinate reductase
MNIALVGYGKMGREVESIALQRGHTITARFTSISPLPPADSALYASQLIDCFIDFSTAESVQNTVEVCCRLGIPLIEGTTGWHGQKEELLGKAASLNGTVIYGNNFSVGAQMFFRIVREAAQFMDRFPDYDVAIHETHHTRKKDSPSGTALTIAQHILDSMKRKSAVNTDQNASPLRPEQINISSSRVGNVFGDHSVLFHSTADEIELVHRAHDRSGFAYGAVLAAEMTEQFKGICSFDKLVFETSEKVIAPMGSPWDEERSDEAIFSKHQ